VGDAIQPVGEQLAAAKGRRPADENQEGGLEGVLGVGRVPQDAPADAPDHRAVPPHQDRDRRLIPAEKEALQQLLVAQGRLLGQQHGPTQVVEDLAHWATARSCTGVEEVARPAARRLLVGVGLADARPLSFYYPKSGD
jgi:hypothetical protein